MSPEEIATLTEVIKILESDIPPSRRIAYAIEELLTLTEANAEECPECGSEIEHHSADGGRSIEAVCPRCEYREEAS